MITAKLDEKNLIPIWQPIGYSTYQITNAIAAKYGKKATHTGVLDPLAEGVIIVLLDDLRFKKQEFSSYPKEYVFDIAFGISTDSYDGMGLMTKEALDENILENELKEALKSFVGNYSQQVPLYSARKLNGKKLFLYPKAGKTVENLPVKSGTITKIDLEKLSAENLHTLIDKVIKNILLIKSGEFRQEEILNHWVNYKKQVENKSIYVATIKVQMSRGLYVRSLSQDIASKLNTIGFISNLIRTKNGPYTKENSLTLEKIFGNEFNHDMLTSKYATLSKL